MTSVLVDQNPAMQELKSHLHGDLVLPSDPGYAEGLKRWSKLSEKSAGMIVFPRTEEDVVKAVGFAIQHQLEIAVKGESSFWTLHVTPRLSLQGVVTIPLALRRLMEGW